ncbi:hypothetical protein V6N11_054657 [Hibiscus sabdariffa]|uniref:Disease resistance N-terminal domain-containing protein n=1 Tax=Hibiscus sabdariffa TaxID=183260 RepID=A0ABR2S554_9ROSI
MDEALLGAIVEKVMSKLISIASEQIVLALGFKESLKRLGESLEMIKAFLQDAEERKTNNNSVKLWLETLKDIAYKVDDVFDEFAYEILWRKVFRNQIERKLLKVFSSSNSTVFRFKMVNKVKGILESLDDLNRLAKQFGLLQRAIDPQTPFLVSRGSSEETISFPGVSNIAGRENDMSKVVDLLVNPKDEQVVRDVPIVGM